MCPPEDDAVFVRVAIRDLVCAVFYCADCVCTFSERVLLTTEQCGSGWSDDFLQRCRELCGRVS